MKVASFLKMHATIALEPLPAMACRLAVATKHCVQPLALNAQIPARQQAPFLDALFEKRLLGLNPTVNDLTVTRHPESALRFQGTSGVTRWPVKKAAAMHSRSEFTCNHLYR